MFKKTKMCKTVLLVFASIVCFAVAHDPWMYKNVKSHNDEVTQIIHDIKPQQDVISYRLPNDTQPIAYLVDLDFGNFHEGVLDFDGKVKMSILILRNTNTITLHSSVSMIHEIIVSNSAFGGTMIQHSFQIDNVREFLIITTVDELTAGATVFITIKYTARLTSSIAGPYRQSYFDADKQQRWFVATHMQPTFARRVFICYDEPAFKAFFGLTLRYNSIFSAISNTQTVFTGLENGKTVTEFDITPLMSTYLIGFVISNFEMNSHANANDVLFGVFSRPEAIETTQFALETGEKALELYENAFETKYTLKKFDQVALPVFNRGGMENYGIIFYREDYLLVQQNVTTAFAKEFAAATIVHEACHMFLGNLLTPAFWSYLWLSEGFCRFYEYEMTHRIYPTMRMDELFAVEATQSVLYSDSSLNTRPMTWYVESPIGISRLFDAIAYSKAGAVIRMFHHALTEQTFNKGIQIYLSKTTSNPEGVAEPKHLYDALQQAAEADNAIPTIYSMAELFERWETQPGYPIVYVERSYNDQRIKFTQNRFTNNVTDGKNMQVFWHIPITYASNTNPNPGTKPTFWMPAEKEMEVTLKDVKENSWFLVNIKQTGYYRVQYDDANWMLIANELYYGNFTLISPNNRAQLIDDASVFFENKILNIRIVLELMKYLQHDVDYIAWMAATNNLLYIRRMLDNINSKLSNDFRIFLQILLDKVFNEFGAEEIQNEPHYHKHIRNIAISWACQAHLPACLNQTYDKLNELIKGQRTGFSTDHEPAIFCNGLLLADEPEFNFMWNLFNSTNDNSRRTFYLQSIGCMENERILTQFVETILTSNDLDNEINDEWFTILQAVYLNGPVGLRVAFKFMRVHYDPFLGLLNDLDEISSLNTIFRAMANRINDEVVLREFEELLILYNINEANINNIKIITSTNMVWLQTYSGEIQDFLDDYFRSSASTTSGLSILLIGFALLANFIFKY